MKERMPGEVLVVFLLVEEAEEDSLADRLSTAAFSGVSPGASPR